MNHERPEPKPPVALPIPAKAIHGQESPGLRQTSASLRDFLRPQVAEIRIDVMEIPQGDDTVALLVEETCLRYPTVQLTGFAV